MKLTYRGVKYNQVPSVVPIAEYVAVGTYRGVTVPLYRGIPAKSPKLGVSLMYRGCPYSI